MTQVTAALASWDGVNKVFGASVATCPDGAKVTGGGYDKASGVDVLYNGPFGPNAWRVYGFSHSAGVVTAFALCVQ